MGCSCKRPFFSFFPIIKICTEPCTRRASFGNGLNARIQDLTMPVSIDRWKWCTFTMLPVPCRYCSAAGPLEGIRRYKRTLCAHLCVMVPSGSEFRLGTAQRLLLPSLSCKAGEGLARFSKIPQTLLQEVSQKGWDVVVGTSVVFQKAGECHELWVLQAGMPWDWVSPGTIGIPNSSVPLQCPRFL